MQPLSSIPRRIAARLIDGALIGFVWVVPMALTGHIDTDSVNVSTWLANAVWITWIAYEVLLVWLTGQTLGKRMLGIQIVDGTTGAVPNVDQAVRRGLPTIIQGVPILGALGTLMWVPALWRPRRQGLHDRLAGTIVVDLRSQPSS